jgi:hypothetical protein
MRGFSMQETRFISTCSTLGEPCEVCDSIVPCEHFFGRVFQNGKLAHPIVHAADSARAAFAFSSEPIRKAMVAIGADNLRVYRIGNIVSEVLSDGEFFMHAVTSDRIELGLDRDIL